MRLGATGKIGMSYSMLRASARNVARDAPLHTGTTAITVASSHSAEGLRDGLPQMLVQHAAVLSRSIRGAQRVPVNFMVRNLVPTPGILAPSKRASRSDSS